jgi:hypothetical protein
MRPPECEALHRILLRTVGQQHCFPPIDQRDQRGKPITEVCNQVVKLRIATRTLGGFCPQRIAPPGEP